MRPFTALGLLALVVTIVLLEGVVVHSLEVTPASACPSECDLNSCPETETCLAGLIKDNCDCCFVCGQREGERCYNATIGNMVAPELRGYNDCGENLECRLRTDLARGDQAEAICYCRKTQPICGTDGVTYENECIFTEMRYKKRDTLLIADDEPCKSRPVILTPPESIVNTTGSSVAFSCEAKGWPVPVIEWFIEKDYVERLLPSDNNHISVLSRGGPSDYEVTSWLQVIEADVSDTANYICLAKNSVGESKAKARLRIGNFQKNNKVHP